MAGKRCMLFDCFPFNKMFVNYLREISPANGISYFLMIPFSSLSTLLYDDTNNEFTINPIRMRGKKGAESDSN